MALISRSGFLRNHACENLFLFSMTRFSVHCNYKILSNLQLIKILPCLQRRYRSTDKESKKEGNFSSAEIVTGNKLSQRTRLKQAIRDYGATIIIFHVAISLTSLGLCYIAVSNGVDAVSVLTHVGFPESVISSKIAVGGSTFVMAYAVHKLFAPVRIAITLSAAPFIVRYLRRIKLLKPPK